MEFGEFDRLAEPLRARSARLVAEHGFAAIEGLVATDEELAAAEREHEDVLAFMVRHGLNAR